MLSRFLQTRLFLFGLIAGVHISTIISVVVASNNVVDLSQPWEESPLYNKNAAYCTIQEAMAPVFTRGYVIIQNGLLVAEGYTLGNERNGIYEAYSVTKSWSTMIIGKMVELQQVSIEETLGDIFDQEEDWINVTQAEEKKAVMLEDLLTMTSGLVIGPEELFDQRNLTEVLNFMEYEEEQVGQFNYLSSQHILAWIILRRSGFTPRMFMRLYNIFPKLGIHESDYEWDTFGEVEGTAFGLKTNPRVLAKLGQLYLQNGLAAEGDQLISSDWVNTSTSDLLSDDTESIQCFAPGYGYQWYVDREVRDGLLVPIKSLEGAYMAAGLNGQLIVVAPRLDIVIAIMSNDITVAVSYGFLLVVLEQLDNLDQEASAKSCGAFSITSYAYQTGYGLSIGLLKILTNIFLE